MNIAAIIVASAILLAVIVWGLLIILDYRRATRIGMGNKSGLKYEKTPVKKPKIRRKK